jgi:outer membrane protein OmpA-like peptidoglycan-associated protein
MHQKKILLFLSLCWLTISGYAQQRPSGPCVNITPGNISFTKGVVRLSKTAMEKLDRLAIDMRNYPACKIVVDGSGDPNKIGQQQGWDRANNCINYLVERKGMDREQFIFQYGQANGAFVEYRPAGDNEDGPSMVPPPFPHLKSR